MKLKITNSVITWLGGCPAPACYNWFHSLLSPVEVLAIELFDIWCLLHMKYNHMDREPDNILLVYFNSCFIILLILKFHLFVLNIALDVG